MDLQGAVNTPGTEHQRAHQYLDAFLDFYRRGGSYAGQRPSCDLYNEYLRRALTYARVPKVTVDEAVASAKAEQLENGLAGGDPVPNLPRRVGGIPKLPPGAVPDPVTVEFEPLAVPEFEI